MDGGFEEGNFDGDVCCLDEEEDFSSGETVAEEQGCLLLFFFFFRVFLSCDREAPAAEGKTGPMSEDEEAFPEAPVDEEDAPPPPPPPLSPLVDATAEDEEEAEGGMTGLT